MRRKPMPKRAITFDELAARFAALASVPGAKAALGVEDQEVAAYARVLEYGSVAGQPPWPRPGTRTTLAVDPESGARVVVSLQAPQGFIRAQAPAFPAVIASALAAPADWLDADAVQSHLERALRDATQAALERIRAAAPRDSGRLAESLQVLM
ncbi:MAG: hypothetical protein ACRD6I_18110 [Candidatus Acidiferrales bacterium]